MTMEAPVAGVTSWQLIHDEIRSLALARAANEHALCGALLRAHRDGGWSGLGIASFLEYAEQFAGCGAFRSLSLAEGVLEPSKSRGPDQRSLGAPPAKPANHPRAAHPADLCAVVRSA